MKSKKVVLFLLLFTILGVLIYLAYDKYGFNTKKDEEDKQKEVKKDKETDKNPKPSLTKEEQELVNNLYALVSIDDYYEQNLDYYLLDYTTKENMSDELYSYLLLKNMDLSFEGEEKAVYKEDIEKSSSKIFYKNKKENNYEAIINGYKYSLYYLADYDFYVLTKTEVEKTTNKLDKKIVSAKVDDYGVVIEEEFTLEIDNEITKGKIKYSFVKDGDRFYLSLIGRTIY